MFKFSECFRPKRVLIPADGFFEWRTVGKKKRVCHFSRSDGTVHIRRHVGRVGG
ncbi:MAG: SOS response-associated peptidase [Planctomycetes bacterium]|nr:SOS response-associated peptidase [Planctomycetota bacterium]